MNGLLLIITHPASTALTTVHPTCMGILTSFGYSLKKSFSA